MAVEALNEQGNPVDWWFIYKVPKLQQSADIVSATGYEYAYFDANSQIVDQSPYTLDQDQGALHHTLDAVFRDPPDTVGWILYNDEKPTIVGGSDDGNLGHTKGIIAFDTASKTAFWLLHSWPKYAAPAQIGMPTPMYGQTFLCVSLDLKTANDIAAIMPNHQEPQVFLPRAATLSQNDPLLALTKPLPPAPGPSKTVIECTSVGGMAFKVLAKNREWNDDFWQNFVGPELGADMDVDTWIRGPIPPTADSDGIHKTFDIKYINLGALGIHFAWPETQDHAKWGITKAVPWICVGDINRMISQRKRGGGCIAFQNQTLWIALGKTDLLLAPPGHTRTEARTVIHNTRINADVPAVPGSPSTSAAAAPATTATPAAPAAPAKKVAKKTTKKVAQKVVKKTTRKGTS